MQVLDGYPRCMYMYWQGLQVFTAHVGQVLYLVLGNQHLDRSAVGQHEMTCPFPLVLVPPCATSRRLDKPNFALDELQPSRWSQARLEKDRKRLTLDRSGRHNALMGGNPVSSSQSWAAWKSPVGRENASQHPLFALGIDSD